MEDFLKFLSEKVENYPMHIEIYYSKTIDWSIRIWRKGCGNNGADLEICQIQHPDIEYCFAKAHVALKDWLLDNEGGY